MKMEETVQESNKDQQSSPPNHQIVKGKRTKRQRPQSPIPFTVVSNVNNDSSSSPAVSSTEEEEDMANCLILLAAQCHQQPPPSKRPQCDDRNHETTCLQTNNKFNSRRFVEAPSSSPAGSGKAGCYVYECKTCNRTFPSFQALGGHRASHKKPKSAANLMMNDAEKLLCKTSSQQPHQQQQQFHLVPNNSEEEDANFRNVSSLWLQLSNSSNTRGNNGNLFSGNRNVNTRGNNNNNSNKIHECSICGAEFTSGQALGGHMRRHRAPPVTSNTTAATMMMSMTAVAATNTTLSLTPRPHAVVEAGENQDSRISSSSRNNNSSNLWSLDLDLNLPAPEDDPRELQQRKQQPQQQQAASQQTPLGFSAGPALVDCHY